MDRKVRERISGRVAIYPPPAVTVALFMVALTLLYSSGVYDEAEATSARQSIRRIVVSDLDAGPIWSSPEQKLALFGGHVDGAYWVCPRIDGRARQPLCRRFSGTVVAICDQGEEILMVLSDGDIHRVDYALIDADGQFKPVYHHSDVLDLVDAWLPGSTCASGDPLPQILALNRDSTLLHFDRRTWRQVD
jgi:hypothetical protein